MKVPDHKCQCGCGLSVADCMHGMDAESLLSICCAQWMVDASAVKATPRSGNCPLARQLAMAVGVAKGLKHTYLEAVFGVSRGTASHAAKAMRAEIESRPTSRQSRLFQALTA